MRLSSLSVLHFQSRSVRCITYSAKLEGLLIVIWGLVVFEIKVREESPLSIACLDPGMGGLAEGEGYVLVLLDVLPCKAPYNWPVVLTTLPTTPIVPSDEVVEVLHVDL
ncbi:hypothetical protein AMJ39_09300 [candidate division TA06 bacterium DG_24]|uniref:Uncharacterized protein n=1 Tax=candidate division TA06 bacterium DG_24 TaxID=1703770 RepID=A0A0S7WNQ0_UNCT6|nr:MAG: hypothetical protein AMJ39_09300 [candidate division TA06 bacterium DG_24]